MTTDKSSEREAFVYWWRHKYSAADLEGIPEHVALNAAWAAWQARAALPQQAQDIAEASGGAEGGPEEDRIEAAFWRFDARHKGYGEWRQAPMSERDAFKAEMRNALHAEAVRAEMRMVAKGWRKQEPQQAQEAPSDDLRELGKWLNEEPNRPIDRSALARVLAWAQVSAPQQARETSLPDCGEAGHAEGRCGNAQCLRGGSLPPQGAEPTSQDIQALIAELQRMEDPQQCYSPYRALEQKDIRAWCGSLWRALAASPAPAPQEPAEPLGEVVGTHKIGPYDLATVAWAKGIPPVGTKLYASPAPQEPARPVGYVPRCIADGENEVVGEFRWQEVEETPFEVRDPERWECAALYASPAPGELGAVEAAAPASLRGLDTPTRVRFYEHDFYVLSNFSAFSIVWDGRRFDTSEHLYHYLKFNTTALDVADAIFGARSAHEAFKLAERNKGLRRKDWDAVKVELMRDILRLKVEQHEYVRRKLLATGDRELVEDSWRDDFWGWGPNRDGKNMLGCLWMQVRAELMAAPESPLTQQAPSESSAKGSGGEKV